MLAACSVPPSTSPASAAPISCRCSANARPPPSLDNSPALRRLHVIKRVAGTYRYYLTRTGRAAIAAGRRLTEQTIIPALA